LRGVQPAQLQHGFDAGRKQGGLAAIDDLDGKSLAPASAGQGLDAFWQAAALGLYQWNVFHKAFKTS
jgi:hypothetical protein